jgi:methionyl-tRNA formyltransferase
MNHILIGDTNHPSYDIMHDCAMANDIDITASLADCTGGDFLFLVSCTSIVPKSVRDLYKHTLVLHASDLPEGRGWSPWVWAIREGATEIVVSMLEAEDKVDSGAIWRKQAISIDKTAIYEDIAEKLAHAQVWLIEWALAWPHTIGQPQAGRSTACRKLTDSDSELHIWLDDHWDTLRTCDPERFPAWFEYNGQRYNIRIERAD